MHASYLSSAPIGDGWWMKQIVSVGLSLRLKLYNILWNQICSYSFKKKFWSYSVSQCVSCHQSIRSFILQSADPIHRVFSRRAHKGGKGNRGKKRFCNLQLWESLHRWLMINNVEPSHFCQINCVFIFLWLISHLIKHLANQSEALKVNLEFARWSLTHKRGIGVTSVLGRVHICTIWADEMMYVAL